MRPLSKIFVASCLAMYGSLCGAVTTAGAGSTIVFPIVVKSSTFTSDISVYYPGNIEGTATSITIEIKYYDALSTSTPGLKPCSPLTVNVGETKSFTLNVQCTLGAGGHHGLLVLQDAAAEKINYFFAFSRVESNTAHEGFSLEGFPIGNFSGQSANVLGLKRVAAAPGYQTNCFVGALGEPVDYQIELFDNLGAPLGSIVTGHLDAWQELRTLDIFASGQPAPGGQGVGAPAGDHPNARARFSVTNSPGVPALVAFCTVQENVNFGADFRIAKSREASDLGQRRVSCPTGNSTCTDVGATPYTITDVTKLDAFRLLIRPPDFVKCTILGARKVDMEMVLTPAGPYGAGTVLAGGPGVNSFYIDTDAILGTRSAVNNGATEFFNLEVEVKTTGVQTAPVPYAIRCDSGNGTANAYRVESNTIPRRF